MIHIFNRKELLITWSMQDLAQIRDILVSNHIEYRIRTVNTGRSASSWGRTSSSRARTGTAGLRTDVMYQYYVYVKKADYENAKYLIGR